MRELSLCQRKLDFPPESFLFGLFLWHQGYARTSCYRCIVFLCVFIIIIINNNLYIFLWKHTGGLEENYISDKRRSNQMCLSFCCVAGRVHCRVLWLDWLDLFFQNKQPQKSKEPPGQNCAPSPSLILPDRTKDNRCPKVHVTNRQGAVFIGPLLWKMNK